MPELPEVETTLRGISAHVLNSTIREIRVHNPNLRWPVPADLPARFSRQRITQIQRRAKYLLFTTAKGTIIIHLGMSGSLRIAEKKSPLEKHDHIEFFFDNGNVLRLKDPRRFGAVLWTEESSNHFLLAKLGPEPLSTDFNGEYLFALSRNKKQTVKQFIMDSKVVVGIGNIYANEALFASAIHPKRASGKISLARYKTLCVESKRILQQAIAQGGTTLRDFISGAGKPGYFKQELLVYGRAGLPCKTCQKPLKEIRLANRSTVYCSQCQK